MAKKIEINTIYNEDCQATIKRFKNKSVDLVITSPPYNMNLRIRNGKYCSRQIVKEFSTKYDGFSDNLPIDEFFKLHICCFEGYKKVKINFIGSVAFFLQDEIKQNPAESV
mgnify:CR=1 FL=1